MSTSGLHPVTSQSHMPLNHRAVLQEVCSQSVLYRSTRHVLSIAPGQRAAV